MSLWQAVLIAGTTIWLVMMYVVFVIAGLRDWVEDKYGYYTTKGGAIYFSLSIGCAFIPLAIIAYLLEVFVV